MYCCTAATLIEYLRVICPEKEEKEPQFAIDLFLVFYLSFAHFSPHDPYTLTGMYFCSSSAYSCLRDLV